MAQQLRQWPEKSLSLRPLIIANNTLIKRTTSEDTYV